MNEIFGSVSTDFLPTGYGDEGQTNHPTSGSVSPVGFSSVDSLAERGVSSDFGTDATMAGLRDSDEDYGKLGDWFRRDKSGSSSGSAAPIQWKDSGGFVWGIEPGVRVVALEVPAGSGIKGQPYKPGNKYYEAVISKWTAAGKPGASSAGSKIGGKFGQRLWGGKDKPELTRAERDQRSAAIGTGLGTFFNTALPTVVGLIGPQQTVDPLDTSGYEDEGESDSGYSTMQIAGTVAVVTIGLGSIAYLLLRRPR
jgi:hypothetical protein